MVTSNAGHALWGSLPDGRRAAVLAGRLGRPDLLTSYGIRTLSGQDRFFEATSYHRGSVWPFDNAVTAAGLIGYGFRGDAARLGSRVLDALALFGSPVELYCVDDARALVHPPLPGAGDLLLSRRSPPQNAVQAFSAAAQIFFLALVAAEGGIPLPGG